MAFTIYSTSGKIDTLTFDYNETSAKQAKYYAGLKRDTDNAINVLTPSLVPNTSIEYVNGSEWCSVTLGATESSTGKPINVSCSSNTGTASRACKIYLKYNNKPTEVQQYIYVSQNGKESWTITSPYNDTYKTTDSSLTNITWTVKRNGVSSNLNGSDYPDFSITKSDGSSIGTATHNYQRNSNTGIYLSDINNIEERQTYTVTASLGGQYGNASASFTLYREGQLFNTIHVRFLLQNGDYYTENNVGVEGSNNVEIGVKGFWTLNTSTDEYSGDMTTKYYASTKSKNKKYVSLSNYAPSEQSSKEVPKTYSWSIMTVYQAKDQKNAGPNLYAGATGFTGGSLGRFDPIIIQKSSFKVDGNDYYVTILIKPGGSEGNPLPTYEIISEKFQKSQTF